MKGLPETTAPVASVARNEIFALWNIFLQFLITGVKKMVFPIPVVEISKILFILSGFILFTFKINLLFYEAKVISPVTLRDHT